MKITGTDIWKLSIPMHPFSIATGTMNFAQNLFIRIHTDKGTYGCGECSAFPVITGESQDSCFILAQQFASLWKGKDPLAIENRIHELNQSTAYNYTAKSAFDMALYDISAKAAGLPLYEFLGGVKRPMETDLTIGIDEPQQMAQKAKEFINDGVKIIKVKLGKDALTDLQRVRQIRTAVGPDIRLRLDANQGWSYEEASSILQALESFHIEFCEQPMRKWNDHLLPGLKKISPVPIMADESVSDHHDAQRLIDTDSCDYINIKFAKSGGIHEALKINEVCAKNGVPCMMGGMLESRMALTAFAHFASAMSNIHFYDMDTCMLGHKTDPATGGVSFDGYVLHLPDVTGIGADIDDRFLKKCDHILV
jgi:L-Ala-D/L-Glu epimerase